MLIDHAASHGARIVNLALTSSERAEWAAFEQAATGHPEILFVVAAGNDNHDIDRYPEYPAALPLDNLITVTAARADGHLARGVNWGPRTVDLMIEADGFLALGFDGRLAPVSGSSYATARVTALAACLLAARPNSSVAMLRGQTFAVARAPGAAGYVAQGLIGNPLSANRGHVSPARRSPAFELDNRPSDHSRVAFSSSRRSWGPSGTGAGVRAISSPGALARTSSSLSVNSSST